MNTFNPITKANTNTKANTKANTNTKAKTYTKANTTFIVLKLRFNLDCYKQCVQRFCFLFVFHYPFASPTASVGRFRVKSLSLKFRLHRDQTKKSLVY